MNDYDPTIPTRPFLSPRFERDVRAAGCWKFRRDRRRAASPASVFARLVGLGNHGQ
jgi:hypothetical protein